MSYVKEHAKNIKDIGRPKTIFIMKNLLYSIQEKVERTESIKRVIPKIFLIRKTKKSKKLRKRYNKRVSNRVPNPRVTGYSVSIRIRSTN